MHIRRTETSVEITTPAKINLFLEVLAKRPDGYHDIETLIAAISLCDTLVFQPQTGGEIELACRWSHGTASKMHCNRQADALSGRAGDDEIPAGPDNLVWRAADLLRRAAGITHGARIQLIKRIPAAAGLGGASSDAAATLMAANEAWQLGWSHERLADLAAQLGSDVPFFLTRGAAVCRGRGERVETFQPSRLHVVVVKPPVGLKTADVYRACRPAIAPQTSARLLAALKRGNVTAVGERLANGLQQAAASLTPWIERLAGEFAKLDISGQQMSGSGSSYFGICRSARHARRVSARLQARDVGAVFAATTAVAT